MALQNNLLNSLSQKKRRNQYFDATPGEAPYTPPVQNPSAYGPSNLGSNLAQGAQADAKAVSELSPAQNFTKLPTYGTDFGEFNTNIADGYARDQAAIHPNPQITNSLGTYVGGTKTVAPNEKDIMNGLSDIADVGDKMTPGELLKSTYDVLSPKSENLDSFIPGTSVSSGPQGPTSDFLDPKYLQETKKIENVAQQSLGDTISINPYSDKVETVNGQKNELDNLAEPAGVGGSHLGNTPDALAQSLLALNPWLANMRRTIQRPNEVRIN